MERQKADIKIKKPSRSEKAILMSKQYKIDFNGQDSFSIQASAYVPKANANKQMPKIAVTIDVGYDLIRTVSGDIDDLINFYGGVAVWLDENRDTLQNAVDKEQRIWLKMLEERINRKSSVNLKSVS
jgi:hypothetical protein